MRNIYVMYQRILKKYPIRTQAVQSGILMGLGDQIAQNFIESNSKTIDFTRTLKFAGIGLFIAAEKYSKKLGRPGSTVELYDAKVGNRSSSRGSEALLNCIKERILPGTIIVSDCWKTFNCLNNKGFQNLPQNQSYNFADFQPDAHTQHIEHVWREGPATRIWYGILDKYIGSKGHSVAIKKVACDQLLFAPTFLAILLVIIGLSQENDIERLKVKMSNEYSDILINNYKLWPMVQLVNFSLVPLHYQALVVQSVALLWNSYISYRTSLNKHN